MSRYPDTTAHVLFVKVRLGIVRNEESAYLDKDLVASCGPTSHFR